VRFALPGCDKSSSIFPQDPPDPRGMGPISTSPQYLPSFYARRFRHNQPPSTRPLQQTSVSSSQILVLMGLYWRFTYHNFSTDPVPTPERYCKIFCTPLRILDHFRMRSGFPRYTTGSLALRTSFLLFEGRGRLRPPDSSQSSRGFYVPRSNFRPIFFRDGAPRGLRAVLILFLPVPVPRLLRSGLYSSRPYTFGHISSLSLVSRSLPVLPRRPILTVHSPVLLLCFSMRLNVPPLPPTTSIMFLGTRYGAQDRVETRSMALSLPRRLPGCTRLILNPKSAVIASRRLSFFLAV